VTAFSWAERSYGHFGPRVQAGAVAVVMALSLLTTGAWARTLHLVALGDSLTAGYGLPPGQGFAEVLGRALKAKGWDVEVTNAGVSGETAEDGLARYDWSVPAGTDALLVELGANDMLRGMPPEGANAALAEILERAKKAHVATLLMGMLAAPNLGADYQKKFDAIYPNLAARYGVALYPFFMAGVAGDPKLTQPDGLHPTRAGVEIIVSRVLPDVEALLGTVK